MHAEDAIKLFQTVFGIGKSYIPSLINEGARTINDLKSPRYANLLPESSKKYLKYYDDLQRKIPRNEMLQHEAHLKNLLRNKKFKIDIVGSFRRGAETSGDLDVLFTTKKEYFPTTNYINKITEALVTDDYLLDTLKIGQSTMNGIIKLGDYPARRIDVFFSPPELYAFALLAKTGDTSFNKSIRACIKEKKNKDYTLSEKGIRIRANNHYTHAVDPKEFPDVKSIFEFMDLPNKTPEQMVGYFPCIIDGDDENSGKTRKTKRSRSTSSRSKSRSSRSSCSSSPSILRIDFSHTRKNKRQRRVNTYGSDLERYDETNKNSASQSTAMSSLTQSSIGSDIITETDPGEHYEKWRERDHYDSDETYLSPIGSKYTSRNNF